MTRLLPPPAVYAPDATGDAATWPWNVARVTPPRVVAAPADAPAEEAAAPATLAPITLSTARIDDVLVFCTALGCDRPAARVTRATNPEFSDLCERHRHAARDRMGKGGDPSAIAWRLRMGSQVGRPRSAA